MSSIVETIEISRESVFETVKSSLSVKDQWWLTEAILKLLQDKPVSKGRKGKKAVSTGVKREANWWVKATSHIRVVLNTEIAAENEKRLANGLTKLAGTSHTTVAKSLRDKGLLSKDSMPEDSDIQDAFTEFLESYDDSKSVESKAESKASSKKSSELTDEEKKAKRKEAAKKAAETRAANKAKKAEAEANEKVEETTLPNAPSVAITHVLEEEDEEPTPQPWSYKSKKYNKLDYDGKSHIFDIKTQNWLGVYIADLDKIVKEHDGETFESPYEGDE